MNDLFQALNKVAGWWQIRPTDRGDGQGYTGFAMYVKPKMQPMVSVELMNDDLDELIISATIWCSAKLAEAAPPQTSKTKRVIPRA